MSPPQPRPDVETLESRNVPAGNVTAFVQNGNLIITGDSQDNFISIQEQNDDLQIVGIATTVNGAASQLFPGVYKDVRLFMKGGNDSVIHDTDAIISRDLVFMGGGGDDTLTGGSGSGVGRDVIFDGNNGFSDLLFGGAIVGRNVIMTGNGSLDLNSSNDTIIHGKLKVAAPFDAAVDVTDGTRLGKLVVVADGSASVGISEVLIGGNVRLRLSAANDLVFMANDNTIQGNFLIKTRGGDDTVVLTGLVGGNVTVQLGGGTSQNFAIPMLDVLGNLTVISGSSADIWVLEDLNVAGRTSLDSGAGADGILFDNAIFFGRFDLMTRGGADQVFVGPDNGALLRGRSVFQLGGGDDLLQLGEVGNGTAEFRTEVTLNGGSGDDTLSDQLSDFEVLPVVLNF